MLPKTARSKKLIYFDHAATTYLDPKVLQAMKPFLAKHFGNPSGLYSKGREAKNALDNSRNKIAKILNCKSEEIIFTGGGTESVNLAIFGVVREYLHKRKQNPTLPMPHIITSVIEHHAVLHSFKALETEGVETSYIPVNEFGFVSAEKVVRAIKSNTILISIMYANNEIGTIEPVVEIGKEIGKVNERRIKQNLTQVLFHTDACQAAGSSDIDVHKLNVDLMTVNASKLYGPKQVGLLFLKNSVRIQPITYGGGQEKNLRSGTENIAGIVGFSAALELAQKNRKKENQRLRKLRNYFVTRLKEIPNIVLNGPLMQSDSEQNPTRLPNNVNVSILDIEGEELLLYLDAYNICLSTGSACRSTSLDPSHVILAIGRPSEYARGSMRITLGKSNTKADIDYAMKVIPVIVAEVRRVFSVQFELESRSETTMEKVSGGNNRQKSRHINSK